MSPLAVLPRARVSGELDCLYWGVSSSSRRWMSLALLVGDLDADGFLAQDALDAHVLGLDHQRQVLGQVGDVLDLDAGIGDELEGGDHRPGGIFNDLAVDLELLQPLRQFLFLFIQLVDVDLAFLGGGVQVGHGRRLVLPESGANSCFSSGKMPVSSGNLLGFVLIRDPFFRARRRVLPFPVPSAAASPGTRNFPSATYFSWTFLRSCFCGCFPSAF